MVSASYKWKAQCFVHCKSLPITKRVLESELSRSGKCYFYTFPTQIYPANLGIELMTSWSQARFSLGHYMKNLLWAFCHAGLDLKTRWKKKSIQAGTRNKCEVKENRSKWPASYKVHMQIPRYPSRQEKHQPNHSKHIPIIPNNPTLLTQASKNSIQGWVILLSLNIWFNIL